MSPVTIYEIWGGVSMILTSFQSDWGNRWAGCRRWIPAHVTRMDISCPSSRTFFVRPDTSSWLDKSAVIIYALRPRASMAVLVFVFPASLYIDSQSWSHNCKCLWGKHSWMRTISAPASASAMAIWTPIPLVPPVTRAVLPSRENILGNVKAIFVS